MGRILARSATAGLLLLSLSGCKLTGSSSVTPGFLSRASESVSSVFSGGADWLASNICIGKTIGGLAGTAACAASNGAQVLAITAPAINPPTGVCAGPYTIEAQDGSGNPVNVTTPLSVLVSLIYTGDSTDYRVYTDALCTVDNNIPTIAAGSSTVDVWFRYPSRTLGPVMLAVGFNNIGEGAIFGTASIQFAEFESEQSVSSNLKTRLDAAISVLWAGGDSSGGGSCLLKGWPDIYSYYHYSGRLFNFDCGAGLAWQGTPYRLEFDGVNDYVEIRSDVMGNSSQLRTVEIWFRPAALPGVGNRAVLFSKTSAAADQFDIYIADNGTVQFAVFTDAQHIAATTNTVSVGNWYQAYAIYDEPANNAYVYLASAGTTPDVGTATLNAAQWPTNNSEVNIGRASDTGTEFFSGDIAIISVYDLSFDAAQRTKNCTAVRERFSFTAAECTY